MNVIQEAFAHAERLLPAQHLIPGLAEAQGTYRVRFARTEGDLEAVQRLRFRVFNLELGEGLDESFATGRDEDVYDRQCQHLMVEALAQDEVVGTYRMQIAESARDGVGFYSAGEFDLSRLPEEVLARSIELGRACVAREHRSKRVLFLLWRGLIEYLRHVGRTSFFGCSSLTSQDEAEGLRLFHYLEREGRVHPDLCAEPLPAFACRASAGTLEGPPVEVPALFGIYLRHGASILGRPAIDRHFGTIDFLTFLEVQPAHLHTFGRRTG